MEVELDRDCEEERISEKVGGWEIIGGLGICIGSNLLCDNDFSPVIQRHASKEVNRFSLCNLLDLFGRRLILRGNQG